MGPLTFYKIIYEDFEINRKKAGKFCGLENKQMIRGDFEGWLEVTRNNKGLQLKEKWLINKMEQYSTIWL